MKTRKWCNLTVILEYYFTDWLWMQTNKNCIQVHPLTCQSLPVSDNLELRMSLVSGGPEMLSVDLPLENVNRPKQQDKSLRLMYFLL